MFFQKDQVSSLADLQFAYIQTSLRDHIFTLTLNRPDKKNAMNPRFMNEIAFALEHAKWNREVRVVVLRAVGSVFCAGADLKAFAGESEEATVSTVPEPAEPVKLGQVFNELYKPCIAAVHASVYAGGFLLLGGCTYIFAAREARFGLPEVKRGLWPFQVMASLMPVIPTRTLLDWCIRGRMLTAEEAKLSGLVTEITEASELDARVAELAKEIAMQAPLAIRRGLEAYQTIRTMPASEQHAYLHGMLQEILQSEDAAEGLAAFGEKRDPVWKGR